MRAYIPIAVALLAVATARADNELVIASRYSLGEPIVATTEFQAKAYDWEAPTARTITNASGMETYIWARPGKHTIRLTAVTEDFKIQKWTKEFEVDATIPPPNPGLRDLLTTEQAQLLSEYFGWAVGKVTATTTAETFWVGFNSSFPLAGNAEVVAAVKARIGNSASTPATLKKVLQELSTELKVPVPPKPEPIPIPVITSARYVLIAYESGDKEQWLGTLGIELRKETGAARTYFKSKGHKLDILDDELIKEGPQAQLLAPLLNTLPVLIIMDADRTTVLKTVVLQPSVTPDNITERVRETGG